MLKWIYVHTNPIRSGIHWLHASASWYCIVCYCCVRVEINDAKRNNEWSISVFDNWLKRRGSWTVVFLQLFIFWQSSANKSTFPWLRNANRPTSFPHEPMAPSQTILTYSTWGKSSAWAATQKCLDFHTCRPCNNSRAPVQPHLPSWTNASWYLFKKFNDSVHGADATAVLKVITSWRKAPLAIIVSNTFSVSKCCQINTWDHI